MPKPRLRVDLLANHEYPGDHTRANGLADQLVCDGVARLWVEVQEAADAGDDKMKAFLPMFASFAIERLGQRPKS